ncbi:MAG TPA: OmpH family outer membrane protein [Fibrobacteraceae bacterium]|nr:OmpH family outer membrane protein [Fibrobacteraceae bacterium]
MGVRSIGWILALLVSTALASDEIRIAHVDSKLIFDGYSGTKRAQEEYDRQVARWEQQANLLQKELASVKEKLEKQSLMLSEERRKELEAEYTRKDTELKDFINKIYGRDGQLLSENEKISAPIIQMIHKAIQEVALQEGYDIVLDRATGSVLFWKKENDLTQKVLDYLNAK